jgi:hypothetical protein
MLMSPSKIFLCAHGAMDERGHHEMESKMKYYFRKETR